MNPQNLVMEGVRHVGSSGVKDDNQGLGIAPVLMPGTFAELRKH